MATPQSQTRPDWVDAVVAVHLRSSGVFVAAAILPKHLVAAILFPVATVVPDEYLIFLQPYEVD